MNVLNTLSLVVLHLSRAQQAPVVALPETAPPVHQVIGFAVAPAFVPGGEPPLSLAPAANASCFTIGTRVHYRDGEAEGHKLYLSPPPAGCQATDAEVSIISDICPEVITLGNFCDEPSAPGVEAAPLRLFTWEHDTFVQTGRDSQADCGMRRLLNHTRIWVHLICRDTTPNGCEEPFSAADACGQAGGYDSPVGHLPDDTPRPSTLPPAPLPTPDDNASFAPSAAVSTPHVDGVTYWRDMFGLMIAGMSLTRLGMALTPARNDLSQRLDTPQARANVNVDLELQPPA